MTFWWERSPGRDKPDRGQEAAPTGNIYPRFSIRKFNWLPPLKKGDRRGFSYPCDVQIPPSPPFSKGGMPVAARFTPNGKSRLIQTPLRYCVAQKILTLTY